MIPRIIYVFWDGDMGLFTRACFENIKRMNPTCEVVLLSSETIKNKPRNYDTLSVQHKSDWARVEAICETGGVWIDINCIVLKPFESWVDFSSDAFHGFKIPFDCDLIENWAFAAPRGCPLVKQWKDEFRLAIEIGFKTYNKENEKPVCLNGWLPYLTQHQALHIARKKVPDKKLKIMSSTEKHMPYHTVSECHWNNKSFVNVLKNEKNLGDTIFLKINGNMYRTMIEEGIDPCDTPNSHVERILGVCIGTRKNIILIFVLLFLVSSTFLLYSLGSHSHPWD